MATSAMEAPAARHRAPPRLRLPLRKRPTARIAKQPEPTSSSYTITVITCAFVVLLLWRRRKSKPLHEAEYWPNLNTVDLSATLGKPGMSSPSVTASSPSSAAFTEDGFGSPYQMDEPPIMPLGELPLAAGGLGLGGFRVLAAGCYLAGWLDALPSLAERSGLEVDELVAAVDAGASAVSPRFEKNKKTSKSQN